MRPICPEGPMDLFDVPFSRGGKDTVPNLQITHSRCNMSKGARPMRGST